MTILRVARLLKLSRLVRLIKLFKELYLVVQSLIAALRAVVWVMVLLAIVLYCSAVMVVILVGQDPRFSEDNPVMIQHGKTWPGEFFWRDRYFGSISRAVLSLFQVFTLDNWAKTSRPIFETHQPGMLFFFVGFIFVTTFGLLSLLVGVIVNIAAFTVKQASTQVSEQRRDRQLIVRAAATIFYTIDANRDGKITSKELREYLAHMSLSKEPLPRLPKGCKVDVFDSLVENLDLMAIISGDSGIDVEGLADMLTRLSRIADCRSVVRLEIAGGRSAVRVQELWAEVVIIEQRLRKLRHAQERLVSRVETLLRHVQLRHC